MVVRRVLVGKRPQHKRPTWLRGLHFGPERWQTGDRIHFIEIQGHLLHVVEIVLKLRLVQKLGDVRERLPRIARELLVLDKVV